VGSSSDPDTAVEAVLTEPARLRLLTIAADVLGRLDSEQVPAALRPIARFAAGKRARLGASVLAAALDVDEQFRAQVAAIVEEATPQLVEAVRTRAATPASDPIDTAIVAYLFRSAGWQEVLLEANARWRADQRPSDPGSGNTAKLRAELVEARAQLKAQAVLVREAASAAGAQLAREVADTKRQLRMRTGELRAAERARDLALAEAAAARDEQAAAVAAGENELRRLRGRLAEVERSIETARRDARTGRDLDDARLWLLVETLTEAAGGIRRELSLPAPSMRPADAVGSAPTAAGSKRADDPVVLDRLLALPHVHVIVDGYNVTKTGYGELALADQRSRLIGSLATLGGRSGAEMTVVFDGGARPPAQPPAPRGVRVLFSAAEEIADDLIRHLVAAEPPGRPTVVVTSDQEIVTDVRRAGAWAVPSSVLLARLGRQ
jgi:predicted RNA-binding protein with PIN domain